MNELLLAILQGLTIVFFMILPFLVLLLVASLDLGSKIFEIFKLLLCFIIPAVVILIGVIVGVENFGVNIFDLAVSWYYIISISWFGFGVIFYGALK
jgi:hypothetical protein